LAVGGGVWAGVAAVVVRLPFKRPFVVVEVRFELGVSQWKFRAWKTSRAVQ
jgi:hypothetical protein